MSQHHLEIERKYELRDLEASLPPIDWRELSGLMACPPVAEDMDATYFDTPDGRLGAAKIALRRRLGGYDQGWHLKFEDGGGHRHEVHYDLLEDQQAMPQQVLELLSALRQGRDLVELVGIRTHRIRTLVKDSAGRDVGEICQDSVTSLFFPSAEERHWQEWEIELLDPASPLADSFFDQCGFLLEDAGAHPSQSPAKIARALGRDADFEARRLGMAARPLREEEGEPAMHLLVASLLTRGRLALVQSDMKLRLGLAGSSGDYQMALRALAGLIRYGVKPYAAEASVYRPALRALKALERHLLVVKQTSRVRQEVQALQESLEAGQLPPLMLESLREFVEAEDAACMEQLEGVLGATDYLGVFATLEDLEAGLEACTFPQTGELFLEKVVKKLRKKVLAVASSGKQRKSKLPRELRRTLACCGLLQGAGLAWNPEQLAFQGTVAELNRQAGFLYGERALQNWCVQKLEEAQVPVDAAAGLGFLLGLSLQRQKGAEADFMRVVQREVALMKKQ